MTNLIDDITFALSDDTDHTGRDRVADVHTYLRRHPGASTAQVVATYGGDELRTTVSAVLQRGDFALARRNARSVLRSVHRVARAGDFGQLEDGTWWTGPDNDVIAEHVAAGLPSPGAALFWAREPLV